MDRLLFRNRAVDKVNQLDVSPEQNELFKRHIRKEREADMARRRVLLQSQPQIAPRRRIATMTTPVMSVAADRDASIQTKRRTTVINIDTRDRNRTLFSKPNHFVVFLGRTFENVEKIQLLSLEFPNSDNVVKSAPPESRNNIIPWANEEDADLTVPYDSYEVSVRPGIYSALSLRTEMTDRMNEIKRRHGTGQYHLWQVDVDLDTNIVAFVSLRSTLLSVDPLMFEKGSTLVIVKQIGHGLQSGQSVYLLGVKLSFGISTLNRSFEIRRLDDDYYEIDATVPATDSGMGGGAVVQSAVPARFKLLWGDYPDSMSNILGFPPENSSEEIMVEDPLTTVLFDVVSATPGVVTTFELDQVHDLRVGMKVQVTKLTSIPPIADLEGGVYTIVQATDTSIAVNATTTHIDEVSVSEAMIGTGRLIVSFPDHGFNSVVKIENTASNTVFKVTTLLDHQLQSGGLVTLNGTNCDPPLDGNFRITVLSPDQFLVSPSPGQQSYVPFLREEGTRGYVGPNNLIQLYRCTDVMNIQADAINGNKFAIENILDHTSLTVYVDGAYAVARGSGGGTNVRISSFKHGFAASQKNITGAGVINRPIRLSGENYTFLCSPGLGTVNNTGPVRDIFAKVLLNQPPGTILFNTFISNPKVFDEGLLPRLSTLEFSVRNANNVLFDFNDIDFSFTLEITEVLDFPGGTQMTSQRRTMDEKDGPFLQPVKKSATSTTK